MATPIVMLRYATPIVTTPTADSRKPLQQSSTVTTPIVTTQPPGAESPQASTMDITKTEKWEYIRCVAWLGWCKLQCWLFRTQPQQRAEPPPNGVLCVFAPDGSGGAAALGSRSNVAADGVAGWEWPMCAAVRVGLRAHKGCERNTMSFSPC